MATVIYMDYSYGEVPDNEVDVLIHKGEIIGFRRSGLWMASALPREGAIHQPVKQESGDKAVSSSSINR